MVFLTAITPAKADASFINTGSLNTSREWHTTTLLLNGSVLVAGGKTALSFGAGALNTSELYNPSSGTCSIAGSMSTNRFCHTATILMNGKVLVVGGRVPVYLPSPQYVSLSTTELYDPNTGVWSATGTMNTIRGSHSATLLLNGMVLVAGGYTTNGNSYTATAELYNPTSGTWTPTGSMHTSRAEHTATLLPNGKVLVVGGIYGSGGYNSSTAELYDPATGTWTVTGSLNTGRRNHTTTLLPNGKVLVAGGFNDPFTSAYSSVELYDPALGTWSITGSLHVGRYLHSATLLPNGNVLVTEIGRAHV